MTNNGPSSTVTSTVSDRCLSAPFRQRHRWRHLRRWHQYGPLHHRYVGHGQHDELQVTWPLTPGLTGTLSNTATVEPAHPASPTPLAATTARRTPIRSRPRPRPVHRQDRRPHQRRPRHEYHLHDHSDQQRSQHRDRRTVSDVLPTGVTFVSATGGAHPMTPARTPCTSPPARWPRAAPPASS